MSHTLREVSRHLDEVDRSLMSHKFAASHQSPKSRSTVDELWRKVYVARGEVDKLLTDGTYANYITSSKLQDALSGVRKAIRPVVEGILEVLMDRYDFPYDGPTEVGKMLKALRADIHKHHPDEVEILQFIGVQSDLEKLGQSGNEPIHSKPWRERDHVGGFIRDGPLLDKVLTEFQARVPEMHALPEVYVARMELPLPQHLTAQDPWGDGCFDTLKGSADDLQRLQGLQRRRSRFTDPLSFKNPEIALEYCVMYSHRLDRFQAKTLPRLPPGQGREKAAKVVVSEQCLVLLHMSLALHMVARGVHSWKASSLFQDAAGIVMKATSIAEKQEVLLPGTTGSLWAPSLDSLCKLMIVQGKECAFSWEARRAQRFHLLGSHALTIFRAYEELERDTTDVLGLLGLSSDYFQQFVSFKKQLYLAEACFHAEPTIRKDGNQTRRSNLLADALDQTHKLTLNVSDKKVTDLFGNLQSYKTHLEKLIKRLQGFEEEKTLKSNKGKGMASPDIHELKARLDACYNPDDVTLTPTCENNLPSISKESNHYIARTTDAGANSASSDEDLPCISAHSTSAKPSSTPLHAPTTTPSFIAEWWKGKIGNAPSKPAKDVLNAIRTDDELKVYLCDQAYKLERQRELQLLKAVLGSREGSAALKHLDYFWTDGADFMLLSRLIGDFDRESGESNIDERDLSRLHDELGARCNGMASLLKVAISISPADKAAGILGSHCSKLFHVWGRLNANSIVDSYEIEPLKASFEEGTRCWLMSALDEWLGNADNRMFLLMAEPAMGKSVFCAKVCKKLEEAPSTTSKKRVQVHHFFRKGQAGAEGKAMVLGLAHQLADRLPGMLDQLSAAVHESKRALILQMDMDEAFDKFLLEPLHALHQGSAAQHAFQYEVVMVIDGLDEAANGKQDWLSVVTLMAQKFVKLPQWVRVVLSSRSSKRTERSEQSSMPEVPVVFELWRPTVVQIDPEAGQNKADLRQVCRKMLRQRAARLAPGENVEEALKIVFKKSQGQMIYPRLVGSILDDPDRPAMGLANICEVLPTGLFGMYEYVLGKLQKSISPMECTLLSESLLPVLAASKDPLSLQQLAEILNKEVHEIEDLRHRMCAIFCLEPASTLAQCTVVNVHATVLEWLRLERSKSFYSGITEGHGIIANACAKALQPDPGRIQVLEQYALHHAVSHFSAAAFRSELEDVAMDFPGFWQRVFAEGLFGTVSCFFDSPLLSGSDGLQDVACWLQQNAQLLFEYPEATVQLACDAPNTSSIAKHTKENGYKPQAQLQNKQNDWPVIRTFDFRTPDGYIESVHNFPLAVHTGCSTILTVDDCDGSVVSTWDLRTGVRKGTSALGDDSHDDSLGGILDASIAAFSHSGAFCVIGFKDNSLRKCATNDLSCLATMYDARVKIGDWRGINRDKYPQCSQLAVSCDDQHCIAVYDDGHVGIWNMHSSTFQPMIMLEAVHKVQSLFSGMDTDGMDMDRSHIVTSEIRPTPGAVLLAYTDEDFNIRVVDLLSIGSPPKAYINVKSGYCGHSSVTANDGDDSAFEDNSSEAASQDLQLGNDILQVAAEDASKLALTSEILYAAVSSQWGNTIIRAFNWAAGNHLMDIHLDSGNILKLMPLPTSCLLVHQSCPLSCPSNVMILDVVTGEVLYTMKASFLFIEKSHSDKEPLAADHASCIVLDISDKIRVLDITKLQSDGAWLKIGEQSYDFTLGFALLSGTFVCVQLVTNVEMSNFMVAIFRTWDMETGRQLSIDQEAPQVWWSELREQGKRCCCFSSDGTVCATLSKWAVQIWGVQPGGVSPQGQDFTIPLVRRISDIADPQSDPKDPGGLALSSDGKVVCVACCEEYCGHEAKHLVRAFRRSSNGWTGAATPWVLPEGSPLSIALNTDGSACAIAHHGCIRVRNIENGELHHAFDDLVPQDSLERGVRLAFTLNNELQADFSKNNVFSSCRKAWKWDLQSGSTTVWEGKKAPPWSKEQPTVEPGHAFERLFLYRRNSSLLYAPLSHSSASNSSAPCSSALWIDDKGKVVCFTSKRLEADKHILEKATVYLQPPHAMDEHTNIFFSLDKLVLLAFVAGSTAPLCYKLMPTPWLQDPMSGISCSGSADKIENQVRLELQEHGP